MQHGPWLPGLSGAGRCSPPAHPHSLPALRSPLARGGCPALPTPCLVSSFGSGLNVQVTVSAGRPVPPSHGAHKDAADVLRAGIQQPEPGRELTEGSRVGARLSALTIGFLLRHSPPRGSRCPGTPSSSSSFSSSLSQPPLSHPFVSDAERAAALVTEPGLQ